ncbi:DNA polymerase III subunit gamma/tau [Salinisphaera orenii]|uniref:DNA polymerase III subunit gamma/tau n=1 Tax=Salinisphaera orenii TaxID=856731 RepID=UPI000DBE2026
MSFQPLARSWRPRRFEDIVGQAHVVQALSYALDHDQLHHALLFSGTRGVGKTTLARIIAKCLNCERGVSSRPCPDDDSACAVCREIDAGRFVDLIEIDAASRTGVDDTRALMDNVAYAPTVGRTKVYLIDEVHMLSKHSFNALLKTFEEPPPGVEFVLATTEPEKIPVTILSRCLQFPLKRLPPPQIVNQLRHVATREALTVDDAALEQIAHAADGSMRDALSLVDQGLAFGVGQLNESTVHEMLGTVAGDRIERLVGAVVDADASAAMNALDALYADGIDTRYVLDAVATALQRLATIQIVGAPVDESDQVWQETALRADAGTVQVCYDIAIAGIRDLVYAPDPLVGTRMTILRMLAFVPGAASGGSQYLGDAAVVGGKPEQRQQTESVQPSSATTPSQTATDSQKANEAIADTATDVVSEHAGEAIAGVGVPSETDKGDAAAPPDPVETAHMQPDNDPGAADSSSETDGTRNRALPDDWHTLVSKLDISGLSAQLGTNAVCERLDDQRVELILAESRRFLLNGSARSGLVEALAAFLGPDAQPPELSIRIADTGNDTPADRNQRAVEQAHDKAREAIEKDPFVNRLKERLGANVRPETIQPARDDRANR